MSLATALALITLGAMPVPAEPWHVTPGARHFGPSLVRRAAARYTDFDRYGFARYRDFPMVGDERGDRSEIERVMVGTFPLTIGQPTIITREFPVGDPWLTMTLNLRGELNSVAGPTGTVVADAPTPLWALALTTDLDKDVIEPSVSSRALYRYAQVEQGTAGELVAPTLVASTVTPFNAVVQLLFADPRMLVPEDSLLDTRRYNNITLTVTTGTITDIVTSPVNVTLQNVFLDLEITRLSPRVPLPLDVVKVLPFIKRYAAITPAADTILQLDRVPTLALKRHLILTTSGSTAGVPFTGTGSNAILDTLRISSNRRDHFGSAVGGISRRVLQGDNKFDYSLETWPAGWYVADFVLDKSLLSSLATGDLSVLQSIHVYQGGLPGTPQLSTLWAGVQKLRGLKAA
jgi:hypothetical protein